MFPTANKNKSKGGERVCIEPRNLDLINSHLEIRVAFEHIGCISFCKKIQSNGHHVQFASTFAFKFKGGRVKLGNLEFVITKKLFLMPQPFLWKEKTSLRGKSWMYPISRSLWNLSLKENLTQHFPTLTNMLKVIRMYFNCEGRFSKVYQYRIRLLMHFNSKKTLHFPYYLFKSFT